MGFLSPTTLKMPLLYNFFNIVLDFVVIKLQILVLNRIEYLLEKRNRPQTSKKV